jgi:transposase-like protein
MLGIVPQCFHYPIAELRVVLLLTLILDGRHNLDVGIIELRQVMADLIKIEAGRREQIGPVWGVIDGHPGLRKAVGLVWPQALVQRCCVHKLRNLERKAPKHALAEIRADFHRIVYAESAAAARLAYAAFERKWTPRCPGVVRSLQEGGEELLTFFQFPKRQWKTLRTTNVIERLNEEFRRRVKTQGSLPTEDAALVLLFGLVVSGQIRLRRLDGWRQIPAMLRARREAAA